MNRFTLQLEALSGRDMPSAGWAFDVLGGSEPVVEVQRNGGLSGGIEGAAGVAGGARGGIVELLGGASGGVLGDRMRSDAVEIAGGLRGGVVLGSPDDPSTPIDVDGLVETSARHIGEEIPQSARSKGEEIPSFMSAGQVARSGEEIPT